MLLCKRAHLRMREAVMWGVRGLQAAAATIAAAGVAAAARCPLAWKPWRLAGGRRLTRPDCLNRRYSMRCLPCRQIVGESEGEA